MKPLPCARKPSSAGQTLKVSRPWSAYMPSAAKFDAAERRYEESLSQYRGVSPFPLALLDFQMGLMWMDQNRLT